MEKEQVIPEDIFMDSYEKYPMGDIRKAYQQGRIDERTNNTDTVEFFKWVNKHYKEHGSHYEYNDKISSYVHKSNGGVPIRIEKLYEIYKQSKK